MSTQRKAERKAVIGSLIAASAPDPRIAAAYQQLVKMTVDVASIAQGGYGFLKDAGAWELLGYPDEEALVDDLNRGVVLKLPAQLRRGLALQLSQQGQSQRKIAAALGVSPATVNADLNPERLEVNAGPGAERLEVNADVELHVEAPEEWARARGLEAALRELATYVQDPTAMQETVEQVFRAKPKHDPRTLIQLLVPALRELLAELEQPARLRAVEP